MKIILSLALALSSFSLAFAENTESSAEESILDRQMTPIRNPITGKLESHKMIDKQIREEIEKEIEQLSLELDSEDMESIRE
tara:strand:+ start:3009 stop:3254 length:246 start_codon:yes stop_codon:yes gene_type:complete